VCARAEKAGAGFKKGSEEEAEQPEVSQEEQANNTEANAAAALLLQRTRTASAEHCNAAAPPHPPRSVTPPAAAAENAPVQLIMTLALDFSMAGGEGSDKREKFKCDVAQDLAGASGLPAANWCIRCIRPTGASGLPPANFRIKDVSPGSIIVDMQVMPDPLAPGTHLLAIKDLAAQAVDPSSNLRSGKITSHATRVEVMPPKSREVPEVSPCMSRELPADALALATSPCKIGEVPAAKSREVAAPALAMPTSPLIHALPTSPLIHPDSPKVLSRLATTIPRGNDQSLTSEQQLHAIDAAWKVLKIAATMGHVETLEKLDDKLCVEGLEVADERLEYFDENCRTPLMWASICGHAGAVEVLVEKGACLEATDKYGKTPLMWASINGHTTAMGVLVEKGACLEAADKLGQTALMHACQNGHVEAVRVLIASYSEGGPVDLADKLGQTALIHACREGHTRAVEMLLEKGASLVSATGHTALQCTIDKGHVEVEELIRVKMYDMLQARSSRRYSV